MSYAHLFAELFLHISCGWCAREKLPTAPFLTPTAPAVSDSSRVHCHHSPRMKKNVGHVCKCRKPETFSRYVFNEGKQLIIDKVSI